MLRGFDGSEVSFTLHHADSYLLGTFVVFTALMVVSALGIFFMAYLAERLQISWEAGAAFRPRTLGRLPRLRPQPREL